MVIIGSFCAFVIFEEKTREIYTRKKWTLGISVHYTYQEYFGLLSVNSYCGDIWCICDFQQRYLENDCSQSEADKNVVLRVLKYLVCTEYMYLFQIICGGGCALRINIWSGDGFSV